MTITIIGDLDWTGDLVLFLEALDGGPIADTDGYAFTSSGDLEYSCEVPEPIDPDDRLLGTYRCLAKTAGDVPAGFGYVVIEEATTSVRITAEASSTTTSSFTDEALSYLDAKFASTISNVVAAYEESSTTGFPTYLLSLIHISEPTRPCH
jgi:hypothetical protein